jgi:hypothetical protein
MEMFRDEDSEYEMGEEKITYLVDGKYFLLPVWYTFDRSG